MSIRDFKESEDKIMKKKRMILLAALSLMIFGSTTAMAAFKSATYKYGNNVDATVHGFIDFIEGPLTIQDKVNYNVAISGTQRSKCTVAYEVEVGGDESATLRLKFSGKTKELTSFAD